MEQESEISRLISMLSSPDADAQESAARQLGTIGPQARAAISTLARVLMSTTDEYVRAAVTEALGHLGTAAVPALVRMLDSQSSVVCLSAVYALGRVRPPSDVAVGRLTELLLQDLSKGATGTGAEVQWAAIEALGNIGPAAIRAVPALLRQPDAASALASMGPATVPALVEALPSGVAQAALCQIGSPAIPLLVSALASKVASVRAASAEILGRIGSRAAVPPLLSLARNDEDWQARVEAFRAIIRLDPASLSPHELWKWLAPRVERAFNHGAAPCVILVPSELSDLVRHVLKTAGVPCAGEQEHEAGMCRYVTAFSVDNTGVAMLESALAEPSRSARGPG
jgi:HEAT repeat protein